MVYLKANLWNLKMYTATVFLKKGQQPMLEKYFKEKHTCGMKCELVNEKSVTVWLKV
jgi:hypothetical protein